MGYFSLIYLAGGGLLSLTPIELPVSSFGLLMFALDFRYLDDEDSAEHDQSISLFNLHNPWRK
jgi:hypothetical protein